MARPPPNIHGVLVIDKPKGPTSHDVVAKVRKALGTRAVGHAGTLDPMATGVLVVAVGEATKLVPWLTADDKAYETTIRLGTATDTLDAEGNVDATASVPTLVAEIVEAALDLERARTEQIPPAFSAIRIAGERAHDLARQGKLDGDLPARAVAVRSLELVALGDGTIDVRADVAKGYFVRALGRDLAVALGTVGHLVALRRLRSGAFTLADAVPFDEITPDRLMPVSVAAARALPVSVLDEAGVRAAGFGQRIAPEQLRDPHPGPSAWVDARQELVAVGACEADGFGRVIRGFSAIS